MKKQKNGPSVQQMRSRYGRLKGRLGKLGPVLLGTITQRTIQRDDPQNPGSKRSYGPYHQWTFKRHGKTVTKNLTAGQAKRFQRAIDNNRRMENTIKEMRNLSLEILEASTKGVKKRKPRE